MPVSLPLHEVLREMNEAEGSCSSSAPAGPWESGTARPELPLCCCNAPFQEGRARPLLPGSQRRQHPVSRGTAQQGTDKDVWACRQAWAGEPCFQSLQDRAAGFMALESPDANVRRGTGALSAWAGVKACIDSASHRSVAPPLRATDIPPQRKAPSSRL